MKDFVDKFVDSLIIAAVVPSLIFVTMLFVFFEPIVPMSITARLISLTEQRSVLVLILAAIVGFTLSNFKDIVVRLYRGHYVPQKEGLGNFLERRAARRLRGSIEKLGTKIKQLEEKGFEDTYIEIYKNEHYALVAKNSDTFPPIDEPVLPTRLGNLLRAAETYPADQYGIDAVLIWPRLKQCIPNKHYDETDQTSNKMVFLLNSSLLSFVLAILCFAAAGLEYIVYQFALSNLGSPIYLIATNLPAEVYRQRVLLYIFTAIVCLIVAWFFYRTSLPFAVEYGQMFRSAFDLYRNKLLRQLNQPVPKDNLEEFDQWRKISEFLMYGERRGPLYFSYKYARNKTPPARKIINNNTTEKD
jgi:hypothetical protein